MNILVSASRDGGMKDRIEGFTIRSEVMQGGRLYAITYRALKCIPSPRRAIGNTHVYIMGALPDITQKIHTPSKHHTYPNTECIYTESPSQTVHRLKSEIKNLPKNHQEFFCIITSCDIAKYDHNLLKQHHSALLHQRLQHNAKQTRKKL